MSNILFIYDTSVRVAPIGIRQHDIKASDCLIVHTRETTKGWEARVQVFAARHGGVIGVRGNALRTKIYRQRRRHKAATNHANHYSVAVDTYSYPSGSDGVYPSFLMITCQQAQRDNQLTNSAIESCSSWSSTTRMALKAISSLGMSFSSKSAASNVSGPGLKL
eukprot:1176071-Prorocentrum_minimum.AAC.3